MNSWLSLSLRERHGLVYTVDSSMVSYGDTGLWAVYFGCDPADVSKCRRLVRRQLDRLMEKPLSPSQLSAAKQQLKGQIAIACDNRENFALDFGKSFLHYGKEKNIDRLYQQIEAVKAQEIQEVAVELFAPANITTLIYL
jgi:predicted Zn-dependent peptidase